MCATPVISDNPIPPAELVDALNTLGVCFMRGGNGVPSTFAPGVLLSALARSPESRLRMALIPLLLAHPEFATEVREVAESLPPDRAILLRCYYTAAYWLQAKYRNRLQAIRGVQPSLPNLFGEELGLTEQIVPDSALRVLALRQQERTGIALNWLGTYEHAAQSWLRFTEYEKRWQRSHMVKSTHS